jgi:hypothetical protein
MSIETSRTQIKILFRGNIYRHIIGDLRILDTIQTPKYENTCAVPTLSLILSSLDFIGYMLRESGNPDETESNIKTSMKYNNYFPEVYTDDVIKDLIVFYRHGIMHSFYPRQTSSKIYGLHKSESKTLIEQQTIEGKTFQSLNVNILSTDFKHFIDKLYEEIKQTDNPTLLENMLKGFKIIYSENIPSATTTLQTTIPYGVTFNKKN